MSRDWNSPKYNKWRKRVYARDGFRCRLCGSTYDLNAHHIKMWARYPSLRFSHANGITLCKICHFKVTGHEEQYESVLQNLVRPQNKSVKIALILMRYD